MDYEKTNSFEKLMAWQHAHKFVLSVYRCTRTFPKEERFGLCGQFQRAAVSIAANIAEGYRRKGDAEKLRFFNIAQGSLEECRYYIILSKDLEYITAKQKEDLTDMISITSLLLNNYCKKIVLKQEAF